MDQYEFLETLEDSYFPNATYKYKFRFKTGSYAYLWDKGVTVISIYYESNEWKNNDLKAYTWQKFKIIAKYSFPRSGELFDYFEFELNPRGEVKTFFDKEWKQMLQIINENCNDRAAFKPILRTLLNMYIMNENIAEREITDYYGFDRKLGWVFPDKYRLSFSQIGARSEVMESLRKNICEVQYDFKDVIVKMRQIYDLTGIQYKDHFFALLFALPFFNALKKTNDIAPPIALGGDSELGKTPLLDLLSIKTWGYSEEGLGEAFTSKAQFVKYASCFTFPIVLDDCQDAPDELTHVIKRYTTQDHKTENLNPDGSLRDKLIMVAAILLSYNKYPSFFKDPAFRKRMVNYIIEISDKKDKWLETFNAIPNGMFGWYFYQKTKKMTFLQLLQLYKMQDPMNYSGRVGYIIKLFNLGAYFMKKMFGIELDISNLPEIISKTRCASDEDIISLIKTQIEQGLSFIENEETGVLENPHKYSWVKFPIEEKTYNPRHGDSMDGILYHADNVTDLAHHIRQNLSSQDVEEMLKDGAGWEKVCYRSFTKNKSSVRAIFIPYEYINGEFEDKQEIKYMQEQNKALEDDIGYEL